MVKNVYSLGGRLEAGYVTEENDCAVRALAISLDESYDEVHRLFESAGRRVRHRTPVSLVEAIGVSFTFQRQTLSKFIAAHPIGNYFVFTRSHAFAVKNGIVYDDAKQRGNRVLRGFSKIL